MKDISNVEVGDLVKRIDPTGVDFDVEQGEVYKVKAITHGGNYLMVEGSDQHLYIRSFEVVNEEPKNYRLMNQDTLIEVSIDGHKFEVPLGDLIRMQKVCGVANGWYGNRLYNNVRGILDKDCVIVNFDSDFEQYTDVEDDLLKQYFKPNENLKRKAELQQALKELDRQGEEITKQAMKLHQELKSLG